MSNSCNFDRFLDTLAKANEENVAKDATMQREEEREGQRGNVGWKKRNFPNFHSVAGVGMNALAGALLGAWEIGRDGINLCRKQAAIRCGAAVQLPRKMKTSETHTNTLTRAIDSATKFSTEIELKVVVHACTCAFSRHIANEEASIASAYRVTHKI